MKNKTKQQETFCSYGARFLLKHCQSMKQLLEEGSTNKDIEYVQNLRATSQRIRAGLIIFQQCFPKDQHIIWMKQIKKLTKNLDTARDIDVLILFLQQEHKNKENKEMNLGVQYLLAYYKKQRAIMQKVVVSTITKVKATKVLQEMIIVNDITYL
jgi:CHAD domain-containing protein